jgi:uncharacterized membrane protein
MLTKHFFLISGVFLTVAALVMAVILHLAGKKLGIRLASDPHDVRVYFDSAGWVVNGGRLYREVPSEYPLLANIIFAMFFYIGNLLHRGFYGFYTLWVASGWIVYLYAVQRIAKETTVLAALVWLAPAPIYFSLFRFDLYPAVATLMFLFAVRRTNYIEGAMWLGVAIALKGYAVFLLPAYCVFIVHQRGVAAAIRVGALAITPFILGLFATLLFSGWEGMVAPFRIQGLRTLNGESTYDAINYLVSTPVISDGADVRWIGQLLQSGCAIAAAAMRPKSFEDLVNTCLFAVLGFMSFSVFYSPQYVLWIIPLVCFSGSRVMLITAILFSWLTYLYYPISYDLRAWCRGLFEAIVVAVSLLRLFMLSLVVWELCVRARGAAHVAFGEGSGVP